MHVRTNSRWSTQGKLSSNDGIAAGITLTQNILNVIALSQNINLKWTLTLAIKNLVADKFGKIRTETRTNYRGISDKISPLSLIQMFIHCPLMRSTKRNSNWTIWNWRWFDCKIFVLFILENWPEELCSSPERHVALEKRSRWRLQRMEQTLWWQRKQLIHM